VRGGHGGDVGWALGLGSLGDDDEVGDPGADPLDGLGIRLVVEGSEETGGGGLDDLVASRPDLVAAEAILIADSGNVSVGTPTLTTSLRGIANLVVVVDTPRATSRVIDKTVPRTHLSRNVCGTLFATVGCDVGLGRRARRGGPCQSIWRSMYGRMPPCS